MKKWALCLLVMCREGASAQVLQLLPAENALERIEVAGLWKHGQALRLHLGCGQQYKQGYINIDFPLTEHTVQKYRVADVFANITTLNFPDQSVDEVRSHHVFEHFDRSMALALLCMWHRWLKPDGVLIIETPDFYASFKIIESPEYTYTQKQVALRHIFGSHEAAWAIHCDGWYKEKFEHVLRAIGFECIESFSIAAQTLIPAIVVCAIKKRTISSQELDRVAKEILRESMVDGGRSETSLWHVWCKNFERNIAQKL